jgi:anti-sigma-K factor RskA
MTVCPDTETRQREHVERMLARAEKRSRQARKLVEKWQARLAELDREVVASRQPRLWADDQPGQGNEEDSPTGKQNTLFAPARSATESVSRN